MFTVKCQAERLAIGHVTVFVPVHDPLQVKIHWFKKLEFLWFRNSQSLFNCRWCNETDTNYGYIIASRPGISQAI